MRENGAYLFNMMIIMMMTRTNGDNDDINNDALSVVDEDDTN